jgi:hypothetical protein
MRTIAAIILGYIAWTALWLLGNAGLGAAGIVPKDTSVRIESTVSLSALLALSGASSLVAGLVARTISRSSPKLAARILAILLLATGVAVQWNLLALMPIWYHVTFLAFLIPLTLVGASFGKKASE